MSDAIARGQAWLVDEVIGLDLCPFARAPWKAGAVWWAESAAESVDDLVRDVALELAELAERTAAERNTTLVVAPAFADHDDLRDAIGAVEGFLELAGVEDLFQVVGFHPDAVFEGADPDDPANRAARAPVPIVHLLRADEVERAIAGHPDAAGISTRNAQLLRCQVHGIPRK